jgi:small subunit ribosomal protein S9
MAEEQSQQAEDPGEGQAPPPEAKAAQGEPADAPTAETQPAETPPAETPAEPAAAEAAAEAPSKPPAPQEPDEPQAGESLVASKAVDARKEYTWGTGRRKTAIARVRIRRGSGRFLVNKREAKDYFPSERDREVILQPLEAAKAVRNWDVWANVRGGGFAGQAGAVVLGLARALAKALPESEPALRDNGLLTRDARMSERKKPGQPGARKRFQFSKR